MTDTGKATPKPDPKDETPKADPKGTEAPEAPESDAIVTNATGTPLLPGEDVPPMERPGMPFERKSSDG